MLVILHMSMFATTCGFSSFQPSIYLIIFSAIMAKISWISPTVVVHKEDDDSACGSSG